jgi:hypothetical protein
MSELSNETVVAPPPSVILKETRRKKFSSCRLSLDKLKSSEDDENRRPAEVSDAVAELEKKEKQQALESESSFRFE